MLTESSPSTLLILNPTAGKLRAKSGVCDILAPLCAAGQRVTVYTTAARGEAREVARTMGAQFDRILCCGGDGTLNEVIDGMLTGGVGRPLGYIPAGSTNDFAATLGLGGDLPNLTRRFLEGKPRKLDVGCFNGGRYFSYIASFGAFTSTSYTAPQTTKNAIGHLAYILEGVKDMPNAVRPIALCAETDDGRIIEGDFVFGALSNSTSIGGIVKLDASLVNLSDGMFELLLIRMPKKLAELNRILTALTTREYGSAPELVLTRARGVKITTSETLPWSLDGEYEPGGKCAEIRAMPGAIKLIV